MSAFNKVYRYIRIMGTKGEVTAAMNDPIVRIYDFVTKTERQIDLDANLTDDCIVGGHGGGFYGIMIALKDLCEGRKNSSVCGIGKSRDNHIIAFAAEESRLCGTAVIWTNLFLNFKKLMHPESNLLSRCIFA